MIKDEIMIAVAAIQFQHVFIDTFDRFMQKNGNRVYT